MLKFTAAAGCMPRAPGLPNVPGQHAVYVSHKFDPKTRTYERDDSSSFECEEGGEVAARCVRMALRGDLVPANDEAKKACGMEVDAAQKGKK